MKIIYTENGTIKIDEKPDCWKKPLQYDGDACSGCELEMECYDIWLKYMNQNKRGLWSMNYESKASKKNNQ